MKMVKYYPIYMCAECSNCVTYVNEKTIKTKNFCEDYSGDKVKERELKHDIHYAGEFPKWCPLEDV